MFDLVQVAVGGFLASIAWFVLGSMLYMNPLVAKIYKEFENHPSMKRWDDMKKYVGSMYALILVQCLLFALFFAFVKPLLLGDLALNIFLFGMLLTLVRVVPRMLDMWIQTSYPNKLLIVELVNGTIGSFVVAIVFALTI